MIEKMNSSWKEALCKEIEKPYYEELREKLKREYSVKQIFPPQNEIFAALELTPLKRVKVLILGQDPYHDVGQAHGLSFSVKGSVKIPPSLRNIYKELESDIGIVPPTHGNLTSWAKEGVLLLNTVLTVEAHMANSHKDMGWEKFTDKIIEILAEQDRPIVFILWGRPAQMKKRMIHNPKHLVIESVHPSPLSSHRGFFGSKPFSKTNRFLEEQDVEPINWKIASLGENK